LYDVAFHVGNSQAQQPVPVGTLGLNFLTAPYWATACQRLLTKETLEDVVLVVDALALLWLSLLSRQDDGLTWRLSLHR
jgi:hypothetical protein